MSATPPSPTDAPLVAATEAPPIPLQPAAPARGYVELGYLFGAVGAILFSTKAIAIKLAYEEAIDAETLLVFRMALSLPIYALVAGLAVRDRVRHGRSLPDGVMVLKAALVGALGFWFASYADFLGLEYITASFERLILFTYPLFVVLFGALFFRQPISLRVLTAFGLAYVGLALIFVQNIGSEGHNTTIGASWVLAAAFAFAFYQLLAKGLIGQIGPRLFTCVAMAGAAVGAFVNFLVTHPLADLLVSSRVALLSVYLAVGATVLPSFMLNAALHRISAQANATIGTVSPVVTVLLAVLVLGERLTVTDVLGTALVLIGVGWFTLAGRRTTA